MEGRRRSRKSQEADSNDDLEASTRVTSDVARIQW